MITIKKLVQIIFIVFFNNNTLAIENDPAFEKYIEKVANDENVFLLKEVVNDLILNKINIKYAYKKIAKKIQGKLLFRNYVCVDSSCYIFLQILGYQFAYQKKISEKNIQSIKAKKTRKKSSKDCNCNNDIELRSIDNKAINPFEMLKFLPREIVIKILNFSLIDEKQLSVIYYSLNNDIIFNKRNRKLYPKIIFEINYVHFIQAFLAKIDPIGIKFDSHTACEVYNNLKRMIILVNKTPLFNALKWKIPMNSLIIQDEDEIDHIRNITHAPIFQVYKVISKIENLEFTNVDELFDLRVNLFDSYNGQGFKHKVMISEVFSTFYIFWNDDELNKYQ